MNAIEIKRVSAEILHPLRINVLNQNPPTKPGDDHPLSAHFGAYVAGELQGCASMYHETFALIPELSGWRLRGMGVVSENRRLGLGRRLVEACFAYCREQSGEVYWCNARINAIEFYEALGLVKDGDEFMGLGGIPHYVMWVRL